MALPEAKGNGRAHEAKQLALQCGTAMHDSCFLEP